MKLIAGIIFTILGIYLLIRYVIKKPYTEDNSSEMYESLNFNYLMLIIFSIFVGLGLIALYFQ
jgi:putative Mn2+ efflux pump MntP